MFEIKKLADLLEGIGMGAAHKAITDNRDIEWFLAAHDPIILPLSLPTMGIADLDHRAQNIVPGLLLHHYGIGEHTAVPADVLEGLR